MNREEALEAIQSGSTREVVQLALMNKIYDDFESRICKNCEHHIKCVLAIQTSHIKDFGCNRFERKEQ